MEDIDMTQISAIEDLGEFLSNQTNCSISDEWKGFELDYADDANFLDFPQGKHFCSSKTIPEEQTQMHQAHKKTEQKQQKQYNGQSSISTGTIYKNSNYFPATAIEAGLCSSSNCAPIISRGSSCPTNNPSSLPTEKLNRLDLKKSREKLRRADLNTKYEELAELLCLSEKARKVSVLQEAISTIQKLRHQVQDLKNEKTNLQLEVSKLSSCLQYTHLGTPAPPPYPAMYSQYMHNMQAATASSPHLFYSQTDQGNCKTTLGSNSKRIILPKSRP